MCDFPDWLLKTCFEGGPSDESALIIEWNNFERRFTLHDSYWVALVPLVSNVNDVLGVFSWDHVWQPEPIRSAFAHETGCYLVLKFCAVSSIRLFGFVHPELPASPISGTKYDAAEKRLEIENIYGGVTQLSPVDEIGCWLFNDFGREFDGCLQASIR